MPPTEMPQWHGTPAELQALEQAIVSGFGACECKAEPQACRHPEGFQHMVPVLVPCAAHKFVFEVDSAYRRDIVYGYGVTHTTSVFRVDRLLWMRRERSRLWAEEMIDPQDFCNRELTDPSEFVAHLFDPVAPASGYDAPVEDAFTFEPDTEYVDYDVPDDWDLET